VEVELTGLCLVRSTKLPPALRLFSVVRRDLVALESNSARRFPNYTPKHAHYLQKCIATSD
jgi:hypothetical protein